MVDHVVDNKMALMRRNIQYWSVDGKYRIYLTRLRNGMKDELLASQIHLPSTDQYCIYPAIHDVLKNNLNS